MTLIRLPEDEILAGVVRVDSFEEEVETAAGSAALAGSDDANASIAAEPAGEG